MREPLQSSSAREMTAEGSLTSELDFIQLRRIAERFSEAFEQCPRDF
jgi:hypothetical protein